MDKFKEFEQRLAEVIKGKAGSSVVKTVFEAQYVTASPMNFRRET